MAYGSTLLDVAATTVDEWMNEGDKGTDLLSGHNPMLAILIDQSQQPGGSFQFMQADVAEGGEFGEAIYGKPNTTVDGVTRAGQATPQTPTVTTNVATKSRWLWSFYQGIAYDNYQDRIKNSGKAKIVDLGNMILDQVVASFFDRVGTHLLDNAAGADNKVQSFNACLLNTGSVAGIDQTDTTNNSWWRAVQDTTSEIINSQTIDKVQMQATYDTGKNTTIHKLGPDFGLTTTDLAAKLKQELKPAQRTEVQTMLRGGAQYFEYNGMRIFWSDRIVAGTMLILNSTVWSFRYATKMPEPKTPGWVPTSSAAAMWERAYNWAIGLGCRSIKHNALLTNKTAA